MSSRLKWINRDPLSDRVDLLLLRPSLHDLEAKANRQVFPLEIGVGRNVFGFVGNDPLDSYDLRGLCGCTQEQQWECNKARVDTALVILASVGVCATAETGWGAFACAVAIHAIAWALICQRVACDPCSGGY